MSSLPGFKLEDYIACFFNLVVVDQLDPNFNSAMSEMLGHTIPRPRISKSEFAQVIELFEPYREDVETRLENFDEETQSWRGYAGSCFDFIPDNLFDEARQRLVASK